MANYETRCPDGMKWVALISTESAESAELLRRARRARRPRNDRGIFLEIRRVIFPSKFDGKLENTFLGRGYCYFFFTMSMLDNSGYQTFFISQICTLHLGVLSFHMWLRGLFSVGAAGAAAPTDFWDCYFCIHFFTENIKYSYLVFYKDWENLNYAPQRSTILTRSLLTYVVKKT